MKADREVAARQTKRRDGTRRGSRRRSPRLIAERTAGAGGFRRRCAQSQERSGMADSLAGASNNEVALSESTLADKYDLGKQRALMTGTQAVVRLLLMQRRSIAAPALTQPVWSRVIAARRSAASTRKCTARSPISTTMISCSCRASMRIWPRPRSGARSRRRFAAKANTTGCSRFGTARARASIAAATCSATSISRALRALAARWR